MKKTLISILLGFVSTPLLAGITIQTSGSPTYPMGGKFYGYRSSGNGPGDTAFDEARALAEQHHVLLFIVWGKDGCSTCSQYISNLDEQSRAAPKMLSYKNSVNAYFRGKADSPVACTVCYNFLCNTVGASGSCHIMAAYGVAEDGAVYKKWCSLITDYTTSGKKKVAWCDEFESFKEKHKYTPPKASAAFVCGQLELAQGKGMVYVPFERTNCLDRVETNALKVIKGEETLATSNFTWLVNQTRAQIALNLEWAQDAEYKLVLVNTNNEDVVTNTINCVAAGANGFANPRFIGEGAYEFGEWTLDLNAATGGVWAANGYRGPVTNEARTVQRLVPLSFTASNKTEVVFETDKASYLSSTESVDHRFSPSLVNRRMVTVYTNGVNAIEIKTEEESPASWPETVAAYYTNYTYSVVNKDYDSEATVMVTNEIAFAEQQTSFAYVITNVYTYVSTNVEHQTHGEDVSEDCPAVTYDFVKTDKDTYYKGFKATGIVTDTVSFSATDTNRSVYVTVDDLMPEVAMTNVCATESQEFTIDTYRIETTNFTYKVLVKEAEPSQVSYEELKKSFELTATDTYHDITITDLQHGAEPKGAAASEIRAATLVVSGASTMDAKLLAYAKQVFATTNFAAWATNNNVSLVLLDCTNSVAGSKVGQGLLTHNHAGTNCYVSCKGLRSYAETEPAEGDTVELSAEEMQTQLDQWNADYRKSDSNAMEIVLVRPDGSVAGRLAPQMTQDAKKNWTCDIDENIQRLTDLLELVEDKSEELNDDPKTTELEVEYNQDYDIASMTEDELRKLLGEKMQTLMVSDKIDTFTLKDVPANTPFTVGFKNWKLSSIKPTLTVCAWNDADKTGYATLATNFANGVYMATAAQVQNGLFIKAEAWTSESAGTKTFADRTWCYYIPTALKAPEMPGVIGFAGEMNQAVPVAGEETVYLKVSRTGYTGAATATIRLDAEKTQLPAECFSWINEGGVTNLTWEALESGEKTIPITVRNVTWLQDVSNLVFTVDASGAVLNVNAATNTFAITQEIDPDAPTGLIRLSAPTSDGTIYVFSGQRDSLMLTLEREKSWYEEKGIWVARGAATGTVTAAGCTIEPSEKIEWGAYVSGSEDVKVTFPELENKVSSKTIKVSIAGKDCDGADITVAGSNSLTVCVLPRDSCDFTKDIIVNDAVQYVELEPQYALLRDWSEGLELVSVSKISGSLPAGISVKLIAEDINPGFLVSGTPTNPGSYEALYWMKLRRKSDKTTLMTKPCKVVITVKSLAKDEESGEGLIPGFESARAWTGLPLVDKETKRLAGLLDMTVAKNGRTTAKWRQTGGKTVAFSAASLTGCVQEGVETNVYVEATKTQSKVVNEFNVAFWADGSICGFVSNLSEYAEFDIPDAEVWSKSHTAEAWAGDYTLAFPHDDLAGAFDNNTLCLGATSLRVKFSSASQFKTGKATFAGYLPNGRSVSGTAAFVPTEGEAEVATLPIFYSTAADTFGAVVDVLKAGPGPAVSPSEMATNFWQHVESGLPEASYINDYAAVGTRFTNENWEASWQADYGTNALCFAASGEDTLARVAAKGATLKVADKGELKTLSFSLNKTSGVATGTFRDGRAGTLATTEGGIAEGKTATWRGVALPGCSAFMTGAYWYTKAFEYEDANGNAKKRSVKAGGAVSLEPPPQGE